MILKGINLKARSVFNVFRRYYTNRNILTLSERGFFHDIFPDNASKEIKDLFIGSPQTIYAGFDPTATSLHIGNLLVIMGLLHCQRAGHQGIALLGGATGRIGDPSGRSTERSQIESTIVDKNLDCIEKQIRKVFNNHQEYFWEKRNHKGDLRDVKFVNNADWYKDLNLIEFIANMGRHFRMGSMLSRTSVQTRLNSEAGMSFTEFTYQIFQAYDWLHLLQKHNCRFQLGGSDQTGNLMTGHELISRVENKPVYGLTLPIITNEEGDKFGKSAGNAVWLDSEKTSAFAFYQFFIRTPDSEVGKLLKLFTFLPMNEIEDIVQKHKRVPELREAQQKLAEEVTLLIHGESGLQQAKYITAALYRGSTEALAELNYNDIKQTLAGATLCEILPEPGLSVLDLAMKAKCFPTESDAIRIITAGGFYVNQKRTQNVAEVISAGIHILKNGLTLIRVGKKNYYIIKWLT